MGGGGGGSGFGEGAGPNEAEVDGAGALPDDDEPDEPDEPRDGDVDLLVRAAGGGGGAWLPRVVKPVLAPDDVLRDSCGGAPWDENPGLEQALTKAATAASASTMVARSGRRISITLSSLSRRLVRTSDVELRRGRSERRVELRHHRLSSAGRRRRSLTAQRERTDEDPDGDRKHSHVTHERTGASGDGDGGEGGEVPGGKLHSCVSPVRRALRVQRGDVFSGPSAFGFALHVR
jgi:hypothetical protein